MDINNVTIVGGTHGNELSGIYVVKYLQSQPQILEKYDLDIQFLLANEQAIKKNVRYVDQDLNRQFSLELLSQSIQNIEANRARQINQLIGTQAKQQTDFIIDLHTTTTNMGLTLVINQDSVFHRKLVAYIQQELPEVNIFFEPTEQTEDNFLLSIAKYSGLLIEVGPIAQGTLKQEVYEQTLSAVFACLKFIKLYKEDIQIPLPKSVCAYQFIQKIPFMLNEQNEIVGMIHQDFDSQDYQPLEQGDPIFKTLDGQDICFENNYDQIGMLTACFINEAAYYDKKDAFSLMKKIELEIS
ncbi:aspartoacylase [Marinicellulosiphila megalodicopiae]